MLKKVMELFINKLVNSFVNTLIAGWYIDLLIDLLKELLINNNNNIYNLNFLIFRIILTKCFNFNVSNNLNSI